jgi:hypothetical protein
MGHCIQGVVIKTGAAKLPANWPAPVPLAQGFSIVPLFDAVLDAIEKKEGDSPFTGFTFLDKSMSERLSDVSIHTPLVYLETDFFGGAGSQGAVAYDRGRILFGPESGDIGPISSALRQIGVSRGAAYDEFDALGLGRLRGMDDFVEFEKYEKA